MDITENELMQDLKIALAGWYYAMDDEAGWNDDCWEHIPLKNIMKKYNISKSDVMTVGSKAYPD